MLLRMEEWDRIRQHFTAEEKKQINDAITGEVICPRGCTLDETKLGALADKIRNQLDALRQTRFIRERIDHI